VGTGENSALQTDPLLGHARTAGDRPLVHLGRGKKGTGADDAEHAGLRSGSRHGTGGSGWRAAIPANRSPISRLISTA